MSPDDYKRHPLTPNSNQSKNSPNATNQSRNASFNEIESTTTESSPRISNVNQNTPRCHHHLCHDGDSHAHQQHIQRQSRHIESNGSARIGEISHQSQTQQNIYTNHPDDQSDSDDVPHVPKLPNRPQMMKLPCRNRCTCHEHHHHHHQIQPHHNQIQNHT